MLSIERNLLCIYFSGTVPSGRPVTRIVTRSPPSPRYRAAVLHIGFLVLAQLLAALSVPHPLSASFVNVSENLLAGLWARRAIPLSEALRTLRTLLSSRKSNALLTSQSKA